MNITQNKYCSPGFWSPGEVREGEGSLIMPPPKAHSAPTTPMITRRWSRITRSSSCHSRNAISLSQSVRLFTAAAAAVVSHALLAHSRPSAGYYRRLAQLRTRRAAASQPPRSPAYFGAAGRKPKDLTEQEFSHWPLKLPSTGATVETPRDKLTKYKRETNTISTRIKIQIQLQISIQISRYIHLKENIEILLDQSCFRNDCINAS